MKIRSQARFTRVDIAALLAFFAMWIYYIVIVRYGICYPDEHFYVAIAQRFVQGDRPLVDEWHLSQFSSIFLCLPYRVFVAVKGSTDGIILFMRYLFAAFNAAVYWIIYIRLRKYKWISLITALLFCAYVPAGLFACNYYTMAIRLLMIVCLILFAKKQTPLSLLLAGIVLSCAVLYQPGLTFLYTGYSILIWIRFFCRKKGKWFLDDYAFCLSVRTWELMSLGVLCSAVVFLTWLLSKSGITTITKNFPYLFTDPEFDFYTQGQTFGFFFRSVKSAVDVYGLICLIPAAGIAALSIFYAYGLFRRRQSEARKILFCLACALWIFSCVYPFRPQSAPLSDAYFAMYPVPMLWFGFVCFMLCGQKNKRFFFFWIVGAVSSVCIDVFSNTGMSLGSPIAYIADLVFFRDLVRELREENSAKRKKGKPILREYKRNKAIRCAARRLSQATCICFSLWFVFVLASGNTVFPQHFIFGTPLFSFSYVCKSGPDQSLHFPESLGKEYEKKKADMDSIRQKAPKNLYVCGLVPEMYLFTDLPCAAFSSWTWRNTANVERHVLYWTAHPEKRPECIFVPFHEDDISFSETVLSDPDLTGWIRESFDPLCTYTMETGQSGYILYVTQWHLNAETTA